jgi:UDP-N-acetylglucosamine transferase subunit ALG13
MIFVSVGAQMPFDRLIRAVDQWAGLHRDRPSQIFAQIGDSAYRAQYIETTRFIHPAEFRNRVKNARIVVAHAGMGSIITALEFGKPLIVMPRRGDLGETRNDHQVATALHFAAKGNITAAFSESEFIEKLDQLETLDKAALIRGSDRIGGEASQDLVGTIRSFLEQRPILRGVSRSQ